MSTEQGEETRAAYRAAAELVDRYGVPADYESAVTLAALAYLDGGMAMLAWSRSVIRGDSA